MGSIFEVYGYGKYVGEIQLSVPGKHNALNALATLAAALEMGLDFNKVKEALRAFKGAKRRFQVLGIRQGVMLVDDYAHHPTEIKATIEACRQLAYNRVIVIFQPHRYTRTSLLAKQFGESFRGADLTVVTDIYSAGERSIPGVSGELIAKAASEAGCNVVYIPTLDETQSFILERLQENDLLITMGAGDIWKIGLSIFAQLA
jgi:UDP-N-acetylmuramate--alanine ligase